MRYLTPKTLCRAALFTAIALAGATLAACMTREDAGFTMGLAAFATTLVFAGLWRTARHGGALMSGMAIVLFGLCVLTGFIDDPAGALALPHAIGYAAGIIWAAFTCLFELMSEFRVLNIRSHWKLY